MSIGHAAGVIVGNTLAAAALLASIAGVLGMAALLMRRRKGQAATAAPLAQGPRAEIENPTMQSASNTSTAVASPVTAEYSASPEDVRVLTT